MRFKKRSGYWILTLCSIVGLMTNATAASSASAVAVKGDGYYYAFCSEKNDVEAAENCATEKCGDNCKVIKACKEVGYGAVYQNFLSDLEGPGISKAVVGYSCGQEYPGEALGQAMSTCKFYNLKANPGLQLNRCYEKSRWFDPPQETTLDDHGEWCEFAIKISGIKSFKECLESARYPRPEEDCTHHAKQWCKKIK